MLNKIVIGGVLTLGLLIFGFVMLIRSCLAKYDERCVISQPLLVEDKGKAVVFSLVKFEKTTSYSSGGGMTRRSVSTSYYVQANDAVTGEKLHEKKIKKHTQIKFYPVEVLGYAGNSAWVFAGELMAFDPFTLEKRADAGMIEEKNPALKGKLPAERRYYEYDHEYGIKLTASDGVPYLLNTATLALTPFEEEGDADPVTARKKDIEMQLKQLRAVRDSNYARYHRAVDLYNAKEITTAVFQDSSKRYMAERDRLSKTEDSLRDIERNADEEMYALRETAQRANSLESGRSFSQIRINTDSFNNRWYGLVTASELENLPDQFDYRNTYGDAVRNILYTASLTPVNPSKPFSNWKVGQDKSKLADNAYLQGGFLLDIKTGKPIHLADGFLIVSKDQVGNEGRIVISRTDTNGKQHWAVNTGLHDFSWWILLNSRLYVFGKDNDNLSSDEINILHVIDINKGGVVTHDYFKNKNRSK